jgi:ABC-type transport system substrate-binding protein
MTGSRSFKAKWLLMLPLVAILMLAVACGDDATPVPQVIETIKEVPVEVIKEVPVEVIKEVEVVKEVPVTVVAEVIKEVEVPVMAKETTRLRFVTEAPWIETVLAWTSGSWGVNLVARNHVDHLVEIDHRTGNLVPGLATKWEMTSPDAKQWTYQLRRGVPFSGGYGEFSAADVRQTVDHNTEEGAYDAGKFGVYFGTTDSSKDVSVKVIDDFNIEFNLKIPDADFDFWSSLARWGMHSKAQFDAVGTEGMQTTPAGTGPWNFKNHTPGFGLNWEAKDKHYRQTPEFDELNLILVPEASTRYAMLRAGEVNMVEIPRELHSDAVAQGFGILSTLNPSLQTAVLFGGNYRKDTPEYDASAPLTNVKVREALNRAIDRDLLHNEIFKGVGWPQKLWIYHDGLDPWNPEWDAKWEEKYGFDPAKAKALLAEAGYADGFDIQLSSFTLAGFPEMAAITEYLFGAFREIGLNPSIEEVQFARLFPDMRARKMNNRIWLQRTSWEPVFWTITIYNTSPAVECCHIVHSYENKRIDDLYNQILQSPDRAERSRMLLEIGNIKYNDYDAAPLFWLPGQVVVDQSSIKGWVWSGRVDSVFNQFEYVEAAG